MKLSLKLALIWCLVTLSQSQDGDDFYDMLSVDRSASTKDIRKAFKKVALKMHPDKNINDPEADSKFARINRAYEVLKDEELRKKYDQFGEEGLDNKNFGQGYHSWNYYNENFGIYDDDPEIITLSRTDFEASVSNGNTPWFINYYHPNCGHCHTLAPDWRWLSIELQGVVRIGAVNCDDEFHLCSEQGVRSYPTLLAYPGKEKFVLSKTRDNLVDFVLNRLPTGEGIPITAGMIQNMKLQYKRSKESSEKSEREKKPWVLAAYAQRDAAMEYRTTLMKLAAMFSGVVKVGRVDCHHDKSLCKTLNITFQEDTHLKLLYYPDLPVLGKAIPLTSETAQDVAKEVLENMPQIPRIDAVQYQVQYEKVLASTNHGSQSDSWLVQFTSENDDLELEYRKVPGLAHPIKCHRVLCSSLKTVCDTLFLSKTPAFVLFKPGGGYELHQGRLLAQDIANFAREATAASHFRTLTPNEFPSILSDSDHWFIDFYAPWCPPCMRLLPKFRKVSVMSQHEGGISSVNFGIVDCTTHGSLCSDYNIHSYPTTIFYNNSVPHQYNGHHSEQNILDFVKDTLNPTVINLTPTTFNQLVLERDSDHMWVVDFYASWCGPCLAMAPEYRKFGRLMKDKPNVHVGMVDCALYKDFCVEQSVRSYPTVRLYHGERYSFSVYKQHSRDAYSFKQFVSSHLPSKIINLNDRTFEDMLRSSSPWVVDFYADWCGMCRQFAPEYDELSRTMDGVISFGKIDCQAYRWICESANVHAYPSVVLYTGVEKGQQRQKPAGELVDSFQAEDIENHITLRLRQLGIENKRQKDEL